MQIVGREQPVIGALKAGVRIDQLRWQQPALKQQLRPIDVDQNPIQQSGSLSKPGGHTFPFVRLNDERQNVEAPGAVDPFRCVLRRVRDCVFVDLPVSLFAPPNQFLHRQFVQLIDEPPGVRTQFAGIGKIFVVNTRLG